MKEPIELKIEITPQEIQKINQEMSEEYVSKLINNIKVKLEKDKMESRLYIENLIDRI